MTRRLYYDDCYLAEFRARVVEAAGERVYLEATAFYPTSGGQPFDAGTIGGAAVVDVVDEGERVAHLVSGPVETGEVACRVDWGRRFDHMQQHSGQHLLSAVLVDLYGIPTVSFHLGGEASTIDVEAVALEQAQIAAVERRVNEIVFENRPVTIAYQHASEEAGLRKASDREGILRIVSIEGLDRSACGGTHVRATGEIGAVVLRKTEKIRAQTRIEFLCGGRAVRRARADFEALSRIARVFSAPLDETPALVAAQMEKLQETDKQRRRLATELAQARGRELYGATAPDAAGLRRHLRRVASGGIDDDLRAEAQSFTAGSGAVFLAVLEEPRAVLLAVSADSGWHAGNLMKPVLARLGGRGGGSATLAQGSVPSAEGLAEIAALIENA